MWLEKELSIICVHAHIILSDRRNARLDLLIAAYGIKPYVHASQCWASVFRMCIYDPEHATCARLAYNAAYADLRTLSYDMNYGKAHYASLSARCRLNGGNVKSMIPVRPHTVMRKILCYVPQVPGRPKSGIATELHAKNTLAKFRIHINHLVKLHCLKTYNNRQRLYTSVRFVVCSIHTQYVVHIVYDDVKSISDVE